MQNLKSRIFLFIATIILAQPGMLYSQQAPKIEWQKCFGGSFGGSYYDARIQSILQTSDGGYAAVGQSNDNAWVVKVKPSGNIQWQKVLGGVGDQFNCIIQTYDGGLMVAGQGWLPCGNDSGKHGGRDVWLVKLNSSGSIEWEKCIGGTDYEAAVSIIQTSDSGYAFVGYTSSSNGDVTVKPTSAWFVKLDSIGIIQWQSAIGNATEEAKAIIQTQDGGYAITGYIPYYDHSFPHPNQLPGDIWVVKLMSSGSLEWIKYFGGSGDDAANSIVQTSNGDYVIAGYTESNDKDVFGNHGGRDAWIIMLGSSGGIVWQKCFGGTANEEATYITQTSDSGYVFVGSARSQDGDVFGLHNTYFSDVWVVKINSLGKIEWQKCLGGSFEDKGNSMVQTSDGGYIFGGYTLSSDGDVFGKHGDNNNYDAWIVKLGLQTSVESNDLVTNTLSLSTYPNPTTNIVTLDYNLPKASSVGISVYNVIGERMKEIHQAQEETGHHEVTLNLDRFPDNTYLISLSACGVSERKMIQIVK